MRRAMMAPRPSLAGDWGEPMPPVAHTPFPESTRYRCASHSPDFWRGLNGSAAARTLTRYGQGLLWDQGLR